MARFANVSCSKCGNSFGPGDNGFSHCEDHGKPDFAELAKALRDLMKHASHHWSCQKPRDPGDDCNCYMAGALKALKGLGNDD